MKTKSSSSGPVQKENRSRSAARRIGENVVATLESGAAGVAATAASAATLAVTVDPALLDTAVDVLLHECACW